MKPRHQTIFFIVIIALSIIMITFVPAYIDSLRTSLEDELINTMTSHLIIQSLIQNDAKYLDYESSVRSRVNSISGVIHSAPRIVVGGILYFEEDDVAVPIVAIDPSEEQEVTLLHRRLLDGDFLADHDTGEILLGADIAGLQTGFTKLEGVDAEVGDTVYIGFSKGITKAYHVKGIIGSPLSEIGRNVYITMDEAKAVLGVEDKATQILVKVGDKAKARQYKSQIINQAIKSAEVSSWDELLAVKMIIHNNTRIVLWFLFVIAFLLVVGVGASIGKKDIIHAGGFGILLGIGCSILLMLYFNIYPIETGIGKVVPVLDITGFLFSVGLGVIALITGAVGSRFFRR